MSLVRYVYPLAYLSQVTQYRPSVVLYITNNVYITSGFVESHHALRNFYTGKSGTFVVFFSLETQRVIMLYRGLEPMYVCMYRIQKWAIYDTHQPI